MTCIIARDISRQPGMEAKWSFNMEIGLKPQGADIVCRQNEKRNAVMSQTLGKKTGASMARGKRHWFKPRLRRRQEAKGETLR